MHLPTILNLGDIMLKIRTIEVQGTFSLETTVEVTTTQEVCIGDDSCQETQYNDMAVAVSGDAGDETFAHELLEALQEADVKFWPDASPEELLRCLVSACGYDTEGEEETLLGHVQEYFSPSGPGAAAREVAYLQRQLVSAVKRLDETGAELHDVKEILGTMVTMEDYLKVVTERDDAESRFRVSDTLRADVAQLLREVEEKHASFRNTALGMEAALNGAIKDLRSSLQARSERFQTLQEENLRNKEHIRGLKLLMETMVRDYQLLQKEVK
jgi:hypothetical protein